MLKEQREQGHISEGEFRKGMIEKIISFFEKAHIFERAQEILKAENIKEVITFEEFRDFLIRVNGVVRDIPIKDREADGQTAVLGSDISYERLPLQEDKEELLLKAYENIDKIPKDELKYFVPLIITGIHLFKDGNGRTARIFNLLFSGFNSPEDLYRELEKTLDIDGRYNTLDINPGIIKENLKRFVLKQYGLDTWKNQPMIKELNIQNGVLGQLQIDPDICAKANHFSKICYTDQDFGFLSILSVLKDKSYFNECLEDISLGRKRISIKLADKYLNENDWNEIYKIYFGLKRQQRGDILIDMFIDPDKYKIDESTTLKDKLINSLHTEL